MLSEHERIIRGLGCGAASAALIGSSLGCTGPPPDPDAPQRNTAVVRIDGRDSGQRHLVHCGKTQWLLTIETVGEDDGFTAMVREGAGLRAEFVKLRDMSGFTGSAWRGGVGQLEARRSETTVSISGTAYGHFGDRFLHPQTAAFAIKATC